MKLDWKKLLNVRQNEVIGLDIGSSAVKMVKLSKETDGCVVTGANIVDITNQTEEANGGNEINIVEAMTCPPEMIWVVKKSQLVKASDVLFKLCQK